jgi:hypothetical protein
VKKKLTLLMTAITVFLIFTPAMNVEASYTSDPNSTMNTGIEALGTSGIMALEWEETEWILASKDGYFWKRLWSITYGEWLSEWIRLEPIPPGWDGPNG